MEDYSGETGTHRTSEQSSDQFGIAAIRRRWLSSSGYGKLRV